jgi:hypothetical protein
MVVKKGAWQMNETSPIIYSTTRTKASASLLGKDATAWMGQTQVAKRSEPK